VAYLRVSRMCDATLSDSENPRAAHGRSVILLSSLSLSLSLSLGLSAMYYKI
jgi:hypothetical protein